MKAILATSILMLAMIFPFASAQVAIIPKPVKMVEMPGRFIVDNKTVIYLDNADFSVKRVVDDFSALIKTPLGFETKYARKLPSSNFIRIIPDLTILNDEAYILKVSTEKVEISASSAAGVFYALQTLKQIMPSDIEGKTLSTRNWEIPCVEIEDSPRFEYRGFMLDVARHFQPVDVMKRFIDLLAFYKINHLHLHLTDDQGWRIEIKKYPELQKISAWRKESMVGHSEDKPRIYDGIRHGGYYTQDQLKEIVRYAGERFITIVPEIEMPGHSTAALAAYPDLTCFPKKFEVTPDYGVFEDVYCTKESTFKFLEDVLSEVVEIFPGKLIHIGGDECPKTRWKVCPQCQQRIQTENLKDENELQSYFIKRIQKFLNSKGRNIIGWDEIMEGGLAQGASVMYWRTWLGDDHITDIVRAGCKMVMTPLDPLYFNLYENKERLISPLAYPGLIPLEKVYEYNPIPAKLSVNDAENIIGIQANLWSEYVNSMESAEYMSFPRACALSEVAWSPAVSRDYGDFIRRLKTNSKHLEVMKVNFSKYFLE